MNSERLKELMEEYIGFSPRGPLPEWVDYDLAAEAIMEELKQEMPA